MDNDEIVQKMMGDISIEEDKIDRLYPILKSFDHSMKLANFTGNLFFSILSLGLIGGGIGMFIKGLHDGEFAAASSLFLGGAGVMFVGNLITKRIRKINNKNLFKKGYKIYQKMALSQGLDAVSQQEYKDAITDFKNLTFSEILTQGHAFKIGNIGEFSQFELMLMHSQVDFAHDLGDVKVIQEKIKDIEMTQDISDIYGEEYVDNSVDKSLESKDDEIAI